LLPPYAVGFRLSKLEGKAKRRQQLRFHFLPTYSPNLNPIERLWRHFRRTVTDNYFFETMVALLEATRTFFLELAHDSQQVLSIVSGHA